MCVGICVHQMVQMALLQMECQIFDFAIKYGVQLPPPPQKKATTSQPPQLDLFACT